ncbi:MAG: glycosyltransferase family 2 protein [Solirubrobacteraceae bacterium]
MLQLLSQMSKDELVGTDAAVSTCAASRGKPELSVVLVCDRVDTIARTLWHLRHQTAVDRLELVVVVTRAAGLSHEALGPEPFAAVRLMEIDDLSSLSRAWTCGVRAATGPVLAFGESHCYPTPTWAEALIAAHRGPWAAVGPGMTNANPDTSLSWAALLIDYGPWLEPARAEARDDLPGHNSSYKTSVLSAYDRRLEGLLEAETLLHADLRAQGHRLRLEPAARVAHLNMSRMRSWLVERLAAGRRFAGARARGWKPGRRALYALGAPLIPLVRAVRLVPDWRRCAAVGDLPALTLPVLGLGLMISAAGEFLGYVLGSGDSVRLLSAMELHKERHLAAGDRAPAVPRTK